MVTRICEQCNVEYQTFPSIRLRFCSAKCVGANKRRGQSAECTQCGNLFYQHRSKPDRRYCSHSCAITARNLTELNPSFHRDLSGENNPMFGKGLTGEANGMYGRNGELNPNWKGGRKVRADGYVLVIAPAGHPYPADTSSGTAYILEHRLVMEQHLGRYLTPAEVVHHKDENPSNNALENLQLFASQAEHIRIGHSGRED